MVASKRCRLCSTLNDANIRVSQDYFDRSLSNIVEKLTGFELDPKKTSEALLCQQCTMQIIYADIVIDKLKAKLQKLEKSKRERKTPSKIISKKLNDTDTNGMTTPKKIEKSTEENEAKLTKKKTQIKNLTEKPALKRKLEIADTIDTNKKDNITFEMSEINNTRIELDNNTPIGLDNNTPIGLDNNTPIGLDNNTPIELDCSIPPVEPLKQKTLNCIICNEEFKKKSGLRDHVETKHMGEKLKECTDCYLQFRSLQKYESHMTSNKCKNNGFICQYLNCSKQFSSISKMEKHMNAKHS